MTDPRLHGEPDSQEAIYKRWMRYAPVIGRLPWKWVPYENQDDIPENKRKGALQCVISEAYIEECNRLEHARRPEAMIDDERADILRLIAERDAKRGIKPVEKTVKTEPPITLKTLLDIVCGLAGPEIAPLTSTSSGDTTLSIGFDSRDHAQKEFANHVGLDLAAPTPKAEKERNGKKEPFKYAAVSTLKDATFYRSPHEGNRVYCFTPRSHKTIVHKILRDNGIAFSGPITFKRDGVEGTRVVIDEGSVAKLGKLTAILPTAEIPGGKMRGSSSRKSQL